MSNRLPEQLDRRWVKHTPRFIRHVKRQAAKARRRAERRDPENAPTRNVYRGWTS